MGDILWGNVTACTKPKYLQGTKKFLDLQIFHYKSIVLGISASKCHCFLTLFLPSFLMVLVRKPGLCCLLNFPFIYARCLLRHTGVLCVAGAYVTGALISPQLGTGSGREGSFRSLETVIHSSKQLRQSPDAKQLLYFYIKLDI